MTTDKIPSAPCNGVPAPCDAPVLGEAEMARILKQTSDDVRSLTQYGANARNIGCLILNDAVYRLISSHCTLTARLRAAEERERITDAQNDRLANIERLAHRYRDCQCEFPNDEDACAEWADALDVALQRKAGE